MTDLLSFYSSRAGKYRTDIQQLSRQINWMSGARLVSFIAFVFFIYLGLKSEQLHHLGLTLLAFSVFLWLVKRSSALKSKRELSKKLLYINENEIAVLNDETSGFNNGQHYQTGESYFADLDIFGERSVYHLINRTSTGNGAKALSDLLKHPFLSSSEIINQQDAVKEFAPQHAVREMIIAKSLLYKEEKSSLYEIDAWVHQPNVALQNRWMSAARFVLPAINLITLFISLNLGQYYLLSLSVLITWIHVGYFAKHTQLQHSLIGKKEELLKQYAEILKEFEKATVGSSVVMQSYKQNAAKAHGEITKLSSLANLLDQRLNLLVVILLNSLLMYDVQCLFALEKWKEKNQHELLTWIEGVGLIERLTSVATFAFNHPNYVYPTIEEEKLCIEATALAHPLILPTLNISNDVALGLPAKLSLITGSNMSGKTTFLRTVGVNTLLAQCGSPVCAQRFHFSPVTIHTSIRISDSLQENTSYFMAELKRLHEIKESIASQLPSLVLIDEILRGTNSEDKYFGSEKFVEQLIKYNCLTLFATHDIKLSELENKHPGLIENYCFESTIENDELIFDYQILKGVAQNKNASFLMKKMEII